MLNKNICKKCIESRYGILQLEEEFQRLDRDWSRGNIACYKGCRLQDRDENVIVVCSYISIKRIPEDCPYALEHLMESQENVE